MDTGAKMLVMMMLASLLREQADAVQKAAESGDSDTLDRALVQFGEFVLPLAADIAKNHTVVAADLQQREERVNALPDTLHRVDVDAPEDLDLEDDEAVKVFVAKTLGIPMDSMRMERVEDLDDLSELEARVVNKPVDKDMLN